MLLTSSAMFSCSDDDPVLSGDVNREFMTMFRVDNNTGKGSDDANNCRIVNDNSAVLCWYTVENCAGYEIKWATLAGSQGPEAWERVEAKPGGVGRVIISDPTQFKYTVKHLEYGSAYSFAIRVLHSLSVDANGIPNDPLNSKWYGYGKSNAWADYMNLTTNDRYETPSIIASKFMDDKSDPDYKTSFYVYLDRTFTDGFDGQVVEGENGQSVHLFQPVMAGDKKVFKVDYLEISANNSTPTANVPAEYLTESLTFADGTTIKCHKLTDEDWARGYILVKGLDENSVYNVNVYDADVPYKSDAAFNGLTKRTKGDVGAAIHIPHVAQALDTVSINDQDTEIDISKYNACKLNGWFEKHMNSTNIAENQTYYLEGGKAYFINTSTELYKGFTLATDPKDIAEGKGNAKIYMSGMYRYNNNYDAASCSFAFGRRKQPGESASVPLEIDTIRFVNIDFEVPLAYNQGHKNQDANVNITGNYWFNDIDADAMAYDLNYFEVKNCRFHGFQRGWMRTKTTHAKIFKHFYIYGNEFFNMGFYSTSGNGYGYMSFKGGNEKGANPYVNCEILENTFYDCPCNYLVGNDAESLATWTLDQAYNITIANNTFVNFNTLSNIGLINPKSGKGVPRGSKFTVKKNLFAQAYDEDDKGRAGKHELGGIRIEEIKGVGSEPIYFYIEDNWSTSDHLNEKTNQVFSNYAFDYSYGKLPEGSIVLNDDPTQDKNSENLKVKYEEGITNTVLMKDPNPKHHYEDITTCGPETFQTDNLDGLYFNQTEAVFNSEIYKRGIGASKWRTGQK